MKTVYSEQQFLGLDSGVKLAGVVEHKSNLKRWILVTTGAMFGGVLLYFTFRDISLKELVAGVGQMKPRYLIPCALLAVCGQFLKAIRFGIILRPFCKMDVKSLWNLINVWGAANVIMPARLGEFVRPYLLLSRGASFSSTLGAVIVERFFDLFGLLLILAVALFTTPQIPHHYNILGEVLLVGLGTGYVAVLSVLAKRDRARSMVSTILSILPQRVALTVEGIFERLVEGLTIMASFTQVLMISVYSVAIWVIASGLIYLFLQGFSIEAPFMAAVTIQIFLALGVVLPSAPGFIGTFHAVGRYSLALFGIGATMAVSFAIIYHLFILGMALALGLLSYLTSDFRFDKRKWSREKGH